MAQRLNLADTLKLQKQLYQAKGQQGNVIVDYLLPLGINSHVNYLSNDPAVSPEIPESVETIRPASGTGEASENWGYFPTMALSQRNKAGFEVICVIDEPELFRELQQWFFEHASMKLIQVSPHRDPTVIDAMAEDARAVIADVASIFDTRLMDFEDNDGFIQCWLSRSSTAEFREFLSASQFPQEVCFQEMGAQDKDTFLVGLQQQIQALDVPAPLEPELDSVGFFPNTLAYQEPALSPVMPARQLDYWVQDRLFIDCATRSPDTQKILHNIASGKTWFPLPKKHLLTPSSNVILLVDQDLSGRVFQADIMQLRDFLARQYGNVQVTEFHFYDAPQHTYPAGSPYKEAICKETIWHDAVVIIYSVFGQSEEAINPELTENWEAWLAEKKQRNCTFIVPFTFIFDNLPSGIKRYLESPFRGAQSESAPGDNSFISNSVMGLRQRLVDDCHHLRLSQSCVNTDRFTLPFSVILALVSEFSPSLLRHLRLYFFPKSTLENELTFLFSGAVKYPMSHSMVLVPEWREGLSPLLAKLQLEDIDNIQSVAKDFRLAGGEPSLLLLQDQLCIGQYRLAEDLDKRCLTLLKTLKEDEKRKAFLSDWCIQFYKSYPSILPKLKQTVPSISACIAYASHVKRSDMGAQLLFEPEHQWIREADAPANTGEHPVFVAVHKKGVSFTNEKNRPLNGLRIDLPANALLSVQSLSWEHPQQQFVRTENLVHQECLFREPAFAFLIESSQKRFVVTPRHRIAIFCVEPDQDYAKKLLSMLTDIGFPCVIINDKTLPFEEEIAAFFELQIYLLSEAFTTFVAREAIERLLDLECLHVTLGIDTTRAEHYDRFGEDSPFAKTEEDFDQLSPLRNMSDPDIETMLVQIEELLDYQSDPMESPESDTLWQHHVNKTPVIAVFEETRTISDELHFVFRRGDTEIQVAADEMDLQYTPADVLKNRFTEKQNEELILVADLGQNIWAGSRRRALAQQQDVADFIHSLQIGQLLSIKAISPLTDDYMTVDMGPLAGLVYFEDYIQGTISEQQTDMESPNDFMVLEVQSDNAWVRLGNRQILNDYRKQTSNFVGSMVQCEIASIGVISRAEVKLDETIYGYLDKEELVWGYDGLEVTQLIDEGQKADMYCISVDPAFRPVMSLRRATADSFSQAMSKLQGKEKIVMKPIAMTDLGFVFFEEMNQLAGVLEFDQLPKAHKETHDFITSRMHQESLTMAVHNIDESTEILQLTALHWETETYEELKDKKRLGDKVMGEVTYAEGVTIQLSVSDHVLGVLSGDVREVAPQLSFAVGEVLECEIESFNDRDLSLSLRLHDSYLAN